MNFKNNIQAFPKCNTPYDGMALLDYFAAKAMQGFLHSPEIVGNQNQPYAALPVDQMADIAYRIAAAMLEERKNYIK